MPALDQRRRLAAMRLRYALQRGGAVLRGARVKKEKGVVRVITADRRTQCAGDRAVFADLADAQLSERDAIGFHELWRAWLARKRHARFPAAPEIIPLAPMPIAVVVDIPKTLDEQLVPWVACRI